MVWAVIVRRTGHFTGTIIIRVVAGIDFTTRRITGVYSSQGARPRRHWVF
jgi:hypothetical protein